MLTNFGKYVMLVLCNAALRTLILIISFDPRHLPHFSASEADVAKNLPSICPEPIWCFPDDR